MGGNFTSLAILAAFQPHHFRPSQEYVDVRASKMDHQLPSAFKNEHGIVSHAIRSR